MKDYKLYLIDLDGTIYTGNTPIKHSKKFVEYLEESNLDYLFITNNSTKTASQVVAKLESMGITTSEEHIYTSALAASEYAHKKNYKNIHVIGEQGLREALEDNNLNLVGHSDADAVIIGLDRKLTYDKLSDASLALQRGIPFIATNPDKLLPTENGMTPSNGGQVKFLEYATSREAVVIGKPSTIIMELAIEKFGYKKEEIVMVGDNYDTDIMSGINIGIDTIHVQTGVTSKEEVLSKEKQPTYTFENLNEFLENKGV
ncbi:MAG: TIGR01457 family HAD-type hydrolase [Gemella sp.]|nr:TIGR01457 family HAD-type hydrolase [Gemella sp.]